MEKNQLYIPTLNCFISVNMQVNPNYTSTFVFDNDFPAMRDLSPAPGKYIKSLLTNDMPLVVCYR